MVKVRKNDRSINSLHFTRLSCRELSLLVESLKNNTQVKSLKLFDHQEATLGALILELIEKNHSLESLDLGLNRMTDADCRLICGGLEKNNAIKRLNLSQNKFGSPGLISLGDMLKRNHTIEELNIDHNEIGDEGIVSLCEGLKENQSLTKLTLLGGFHKVFREGIDTLESLLLTNDRITTLTLHFEEYYDDSIKRHFEESDIRRQLENNRIFSERKSPVLD